MRLRVGFFLVAGGFIAALAGAGSSVAKDVRIGPVALTLPPPEGYCELIAGQPSDDSSIKKLSALLLSQLQSELLAVSAECGQLAAWRAQPGSQLGAIATYQTPIATKDSTLPREQVIKGACAFARSEGEKNAQASPDLAKRLEAAIQRTVKFNSTSLGVLAESADACYSGTMIKMRIGEGAEVLRIAISAATVVKGKALIYQFQAAYEDAATVTTTLARARRNVAALLAANGG
jgi:hypothetical protein